jgi:drug/metabolite transporter (DMT)-like permease
MKDFKKFLSPALLLLAAMIWGFAFSAQKAAEAVPPLTLGATRSLFATVFLIFVILILDKKLNTGRRLFSKAKKIDLNRTEIIGGIICGTILATASFFQQLGINRGTEAGKASFITALYVVLVPIYALALKKKAPLNVWLSLPIAIVGFYFLCITEKFTMQTSDVFVLLCSLIFPIHILAVDRFSPGCDGVRMSCVQFFTATVVNLILALIFEFPIATGAVFDSVLPLLFLGIGSSGIAYTLQIIGQRGANPAAASILLSLESVFGVLGSAIFLSEKMTGGEYLGCGLVFFAVILSQLDIDAIFKRKRRE